LFPVLTAIWLAEAAVAEAVNVTGLPVRTPDVAVTVLLFVPAVAPSCHELNAAMPAPFVTTVLPLGELIEPPPLATANVTLTPDTGLLFASVTNTVGAVGTAVPTAAV
jgi:hypothetical protein